MVLYGFRAKNCETNRNNSNRRGRRRQTSSSGGRMVNVSGPGGFRLNFPIPRIPRLLGAGNMLSSGNSVYPRVDLDMPTVILSQAVAAGALASVVNLDPSTLVPNWVSRISNLFREYCLVGAKFEISLVSSTNAAGCVIAFVDETLATAPNAGSVFTPHLEVPIAQYPDASIIQVLEYKPRGSYTDLDWVPTTAVSVKQWLKFFASTANTATGGTTTANLLVRGTLAFAFRGFSNF